MHTFLIVQFGLENENNNKYINMWVHHFVFMIHSSVFKKNQKQFCSL